MRNARNPFSTPTILVAKTQLAPFVLDLIQGNGLVEGVYYEPFAGGAGVAWQLLMMDIPEVWINDLDPAIHAFWSAVYLSIDPTVRMACC